MGAGASGTIFFSVLLPPARGEAATAAPYFLPLYVHHSVGLHVGGVVIGSEG